MRPHKDDKAERKGMSAPAISEQVLRFQFGQLIFATLAISV
jgi:hypothetical protein